MFRLTFLFGYFLLQIQTCNLQFPSSSPSILEQANNSGSIIQGRVHKIKDNVVTLKSSKFIKGCGPRTVALKGFRGSAKCGIDLPKLGSEIIVFVCQASPNRRWWKLNDYADFSGLVTVSDYSLNILEEYRIDQNLCENCCSQIASCDGRKLDDHEPFANNGIGVDIEMNER